MFKKLTFCSWCYMFLQNNTNLQMKCSNSSLANMQTEFVPMSISYSAVVIVTMVMGMILT